MGHCERNHICTFYDGIENLTRNFLRTYRHTELALGAHLCYGWDQHSIFARRFLLLHFSLWRQPRRLCPATTEDEMHVEKVGFVHGVPVRVVQHPNGPCLSPAAHVNSLELHHGS